ADFRVPRTLVDQLSLSQTPTLFTTEYNLKTPYAEQWNFGIEREILNNTALSVGYVGNHGVQLTRGLDTNQVRIFENGFLADFLRAQSNLTKFGNPGCTGAQGASTGCQVLTIFPRLGSGGNLTDSTIRNLIQTGQVGELAATYASSRNSFLSTAQPCVQGATGALCPSFFLPANGNAFVTDYIGSSGWSNYNRLQDENRRVFTWGGAFQVNYTS